MSEMKVPIFQPMGPRTVWAMMTDSTSEQKGTTIIEMTAGQILRKNRSRFTRLWNSHVAALVPFSLHPHMLRHTYATTLYRAGVDLRTAQKLMGHSSIQVTADIYTHLEQEDSLHVADKLNEYLSCKSENSAKSSQKLVKLAI